MSVKRPKKKKLSKRIPKALSLWLKRQNPAMKKSSSVIIKKLAGGAIKISPNPGGKMYKGKFARVRIERTGGGYRVESREPGRSWGYAGSSENLASANKAAREINSINRSLR